MNTRNRTFSNNFTTWGYKILQHTDVLYDIQNKGIFRPIQIQLAPCEVCDSDCPFCSVAFRPYKSYMPMSLIKKCLTDFASLGAKGLEITGGGNPMLYKDRETGEDINDIIRFAAKLGFNIGIITNSNNLKRLKSENFEHIDWIRISLIKLDENVEPEDYDFCGFPIEKLGLSYIFYDEVKESNRTKRHYIGTTEKTFQKISKLLQLYPEIKFVRLARDARIEVNVESFNLKNNSFKELYEKYSKIFIQDIGGDNKAFDAGCYVGTIRPYIASSPEGDGEYYVYMCGTHMLFSNQTYDKSYALCRVEDILSTWQRMSENLLTKGYPYEVKGNGGDGWCNTCSFCYLKENNKILHSVVKEMPDKNFP